VTFGAVGVIAAVLLVAVLFFPGREPHAVNTAGSLREAVGQSTVARGLWIVACTALLFGTLNVLLPLRIDAAGGSGAVIALVWLLSAGFESIVTPVSGRYADRHGWVGLARAGLLGGALVVTAAGVSTMVGALVVIGVLSGPVIGLLWTPGLVLLGDGSDELGFDHTYAFALMNMAWAAAQTIGTAGGGALANATEDIVPLALVGGVAVVTAATMTRARAYVREA
jgi:MFS family permease